MRNKALDSMLKYVTISLSFERLILESALIFDGASLI